VVVLSSVRNPHTGTCTLLEGSSKGSWSGLLNLNGDTVNQANSSPIDGVHSLALPLTAA
jgi:hypothetical protein